MKKTALILAALLMTQPLFAGESTVSILDISEHTAQRLFENGVKLQDKRVSVTVLKIGITLVYEASRINENVSCYRFAKEKMSSSDQAQMDVLAGLGINRIHTLPYYCNAQVDLSIRSGQE